MNIPEDIFKLLLLLPFGILLIYSLIVVIGNHWILRAGGQTAHENYPKVIANLRSVFIVISVGFLIFYLIVLGYIPSDVVVTLVSVGVGVLGTILLKERKD